jgi:hypothetical protein
MCTLVAQKIGNSWCLAKTRDPVPWMRVDDEIKRFDTKADRLKKLIVQNPDPREDGYYGGINENGVAMVATFVPVAENQVSYIRKPYIRLILDAATAAEAVGIVKGFEPKIGGNFFIADKDECYEIEGGPDEYSITGIDKPKAKTNHFLNLPYENLQMKMPWYKNWTTKRLERAQELVERAQNITDLEAILKDRENADTGTAICMVEGESDYNPPTASAMVFDTGNRTVYYCHGNPLEAEFGEYKFDV